MTDMKQGMDQMDIEEGKARIKEAIDRVVLEEVSINEIIKEYFEKEEAKRPTILPTNILISSVKNFVEKEATDAIDDALHNILQNMDDAINPLIEEENITVDFKREMQEFKEKIEQDEKKYETTLLGSNSQASGSR